MAGSSRKQSINSNTPIFNMAEYSTPKTGINLNSMVIMSATATRVSGSSEPVITLQSNTNYKRNFEVNKPILNAATPDDITEQNSIKFANYKLPMKMTVSHLASRGPSVHNNETTNNKSINESTAVNNNVDDEFNKKLDKLFDFSTPRTTGRFGASLPHPKYLKSSIKSKISNNTDYDVQNTFLSIYGNAKDAINYDKKLCLNKTPKTSGKYMDRLNEFISTITKNQPEEVEEPLVENDPDPEEGTLIVEEEITREIELVEESSSQWDKYLKQRNNGTYKQFNEADDENDSDVEIFASLCADTPENTDELLPESAQHNWLQIEKENSSINKQIFKTNNYITTANSLKRVYDDTDDDEDDYYPEPPLKLKYKYG